MASVSFAADRSLLVPPGHIVRTGYIPIFQCRLACRERMAIGDIKLAYERRLQLGSNQSWPPPVGHWEETVFMIEDGRHEWLAAVALGVEYILVAWLDLADS